MRADASGNSHAVSRHLEEPLSHSSAMVAAAVATAVLAAVHTAVPVLRRRLAGVGEQVVAAVGGGVAASYVFIHLLPELARGNAEIGEVLGESQHLSAVTEVALFVAALAGFVTLYGLDHLAARQGSTRGTLAVHLGVYAAYNALITYSLPTQFEAGTAVAVLFVAAMAVHFLLSDRHLDEHHGAQFHRLGRPVLVASLVGGFLLAWLFAPTSNLVVSALLAVLAGFVLFNVFRDELPNQRGVRFPVFALSAGVYASLLLAVVVAGA